MFLLFQVTRRLGNRTTRRHRGTPPDSSFFQEMQDSSQLVSSPQYSASYTPYSRLPNTLHVLTQFRIFWNARVFIDLRRYRHNFEGIIMRAESACATNNSVLRACGWQFRQPVTLFRLLPSIDVLRCTRTIVITLAGNLTVSRALAPRRSSVAWPKGHSKRTPGKYVSVKNKVARPPSSPFQINSCRQRTFSLPSLYTTWLRV